MKRLTRAQLFAEAKRARRNNDWFERAKLVVAAARDRAVETAQQRGAPSMKRFPTVLQRGRLSERLARNIGRSFRRSLFPPPALGERRHGSLAASLWIAPSRCP